jgi:hypothetical protein
MPFAPTPSKNDRLTHPDYQLTEPPQRLKLFKNLCASFSSLLNSHEAHVAETPHTTSPLWHASPSTPNPQTTSPRTTAALPHVDLWQHVSKQSMQQRFEQDLREHSPDMYAERPVLTPLGVYSRSLFSLLVIGQVVHSLLLVVGRHHDSQPLVP